MSRHAALLLLASLVACVFSPNDQERVKAFEPIEINGFASDPTTPVHIQVRNKASGDWVTVATTTSSANQFNGELLYNFAATVDLSTVPDLRCFYNSECEPVAAHDRLELRSATPQAQLKFLGTFGSGWEHCISENFQGSYVNAGMSCLDDDSPVLNLRVDECASSEDCPPGLRCARQSSRLVGPGGSSSLTSNRACVAECDPLANDCETGTQCDLVWIDDAPATDPERAFVCNADAHEQLPLGGECLGTHAMCPEGPCDAEGADGHCSWYGGGCCYRWCDLEADSNPECDPSEECIPLNAGVFGSDAVSDVGRCTVPAP